MPSSFHTVKVSAVALALGFLSVSTSPSVSAARLSNGRIAFERPPVLAEALTLTPGAGHSGQFHFTVSVPADAGESLGAVVIAPRDHAQSIRFNLAASSATQGKVFARGPEVGLVNVGGSSGRAESATDMLVVFDAPVQPGETVTITLHTNRNPQGGIYLFGVTAYPAEESSVGQFLGYGRIHIVDHGN